MRQRQLAFLLVGLTCGAGMHCKQTSESGLDSAVLDIQQRDGAAIGDVTASADSHPPKDATAKIDRLTPADSGPIDTLSADLGADRDGTVDAAPNCKAVGGTCVNNNHCCGYPMVAGCGFTLVDGKICVEFCSQNSDCASGCCYARQGIPNAKGTCVSAQGSCLPSSPGTDQDSLLPIDPVGGSGCAKPGEVCVNNNHCCGYFSSPREGACLWVDGVGKRCVAVCSAGPECLSGCCVPFWGSNDAFCLPFQTYCK